MRQHPRKSGAINPKAHFLAYFSKKIVGFYPGLEQVLQRFVNSSQYRRPGPICTMLECTAAAPAWCPRAPQHNDNHNVYQVAGNGFLKLQVDFVNRTGTMFWTVFEIAFCRSVGPHPALCCRLQLYYGTYITFLPCRIKVEVFGNLRFK